MKAVSIILLLILLASFSLSATAAKERTVGVGAHRLTFLASGNNFLTTINVRYWWKEGIGVEGNIGVATVIGLRVFHSGSLLFPFFRTIDTNIYLSMGLHANGDFYGNNQFFELLRVILTPPSYRGGYHIGLGIEIAVSENWALDLRVKYYKNTWPVGGGLDLPGGTLCHLAAGVGFIYYL